MSCLATFVLCFLVAIAWGAVVFERERICERTRVGLRVRERIMAMPLSAEDRLLTLAHATVFLDAWTRKLEWAMDIDDLAAAALASAVHWQKVCPQVGLRQRVLFAYAAHGLASAAWRARHPREDHPFLVAAVQTPLRVVQDDEDALAVSA